MLSKWYLSSLGGVVAMIVAAGAMAGACSASSDNNGGTGAGRSSGNGGGEGGGFIGAGGSNTSPVGGSCAATVNKAEKVPLGMYIMNDRSGSMQGAKWSAVTAALKAFVDQPSAAGIGVGIQFFPIDTGVMCSAAFCATDADCGPALCGPCAPPAPGAFKICGGFGGGGSCEATDYAKPAVGIQNLPGIAPIIKYSLDNTSPSGGTPTRPALDGAISYTKQWMTQNPSAVGIVVLASDGIPEGCNSDVNSVTAVAAAGLGDTPSVKTFVIGVGTELTALNAIAAAGGTGSAFLVDASGAQDQFLQAMNAIRGAALSCAYLIPPPPANETIDYGAINVQYTADGGMAELIPQVSSLAGCPADGKAWYYDNKKPPQQILLCPSTCDKIASDLKGQVDVLVGCETVIK